MIISAEKKEDMELQLVYLDILGVVARMYRKTEDEKYLPHIEQFKKARDDLQNFIDHGDYSERDARRKEIDSLLDEIKNTGK